MNTIPVTWKSWRTATPRLGEWAVLLRTQINAWRVEASRRRVDEAIEGLGDAILRDIGMRRPERPGRHGIAYRDFLRGL